MVAVWTFEVGEMKTLYVYFPKETVESSENP
jgi:hypothetical protein